MILPKSCSILYFKMQQHQPLNLKNNNIRIVFYTLNFDSKKILINLSFQARVKGKEREGRGRKGGGEGKGRGERKERGRGPRLRGWAPGEVAQGREGERGPGVQVWERRRRRLGRYGAEEGGFWFCSGCLRAITLGCCASPWPSPLRVWHQDLSHLCRSLRPAPSSASALPFPCLVLVVAAPLAPSPVRRCCCSAYPTSALCTMRRYS